MVVRARVRMGALLGTTVQVTPAPRAKPVPPQSRHPLVRDLHRPDRHAGRSRLPTGELARSDRPQGILHPGDARRAVGRPYIYGLGLAGQDGVTHVLRTARRLRPHLRPRGHTEPRTLGPHTLTRVVNP